MTRPTSTFAERMEFYSTHEGYDKFKQLLGEWMALTTDEKVAYVSEHLTFTNPNDLKVYIGLGHLEKQVWGTIRFLRRQPYNPGEYDVREHEVVYQGEATLRETLDMFVVPTNDGEKDVLLIIKIKLV